MSDVIDFPKKQKPTVYPCGGTETAAAPSGRPRREWGALVHGSWHEPRQKAALETGQFLIDAKSDLECGQFSIMVERELPFGPRTARMLMAIANHPIISDRNHGSVLPSSWRTLYELTRLPNAVLLAALADGSIHPKMERKDARALVDDGEDAGAVEQRMNSSNEAAALMVSDVLAWLLQASQADKRKVAAALAQDTVLMKSIMPAKALPRQATPEQVFRKAMGLLSSADDGPAMTCSPRSLPTTPKNPAAFSHRSECSGSKFRLRDDDPCA